MPNCDLRVDGHLDIGGDAGGAVVGGLDAALLGQHQHDHVLGAVGVHRPETDRQHELVGGVADLDRAQILEAELALLLEVHAGDEELHVLLDVEPSTGAAPTGIL